MKISVKIISLLLAVVLFAGTGIFAVQGDAENSINSTSPSYSNVTPAAGNDDSYFTYYQKYEGGVHPTQQIPIDITALSGTESGNVNSTEIDGKKGITLGESNNWGDWTFDAQNGGVYCLYVTYYALPGKDTDINVKIMIDGVRPFAEADTLSLTRIWKDQLNEPGKFQTDKTGSDVRPEQIEVHRWNTATFTDTQGLYSEPYLFYLNKGTHTVRLISDQQSLVVNSLCFKNDKQPPTYAEYRAAISEKTDAAAKIVRQEAEFTLEKSNRTLYPTYDRTSAYTLPNDPYHIKLNTIGQNNWSGVGDYITWQASIVSSGWYTLYFRARQNFNPNADSCRELLVNGEVPFKEAECIKFAYSDQWYVQAVGGNAPMQIYLRPGDTITLECVAGDTSEVTRNIDRSVLDLNDIYRKIIVITGTSPDIYRDYRLDTQIPDLITSLQGTHDLLKNSVNMLGGANKNSPTVSTIKETVQLLSEFIDQPYTISERLSTLEDNIQNLGSLLLTVGQQPLELDCFYFVPEGQTLPKTNISWFIEADFQFKKFIASFFSNYNSFDGTGTNANKTLSVWASTGRDQMQIVSNMIEDSYTTETGNAVKLSLVDTGPTLIQATLAGKGPDVALMVPTITPINLAMRGALVDLSSDRFDLNSIYGNYYPESWTPYRYNGGIYAIPETQSFDVMFYRSDILNELGLSPPKTWDDFYNVMEIIQKNNLEVGIQEIDDSNPGVSASITSFDRFLLQRGGTYYNKSLSATEFNSDVAYEAFDQWVDLYKKYGLERDFNFFNRFRSGEMPLGIANFSMYNQLMAAAPEIRGLWSFTLVPGIKNADGTVNSTESSTGTAAIMLKSAQKKGLEQQAFSFMKWWVGAKTQTRYGQELEAVMGVAARYPTANLEAFGNLSWTNDEMNILQAQWKQVVNIPQIPGNYVVPRSLTNALRKALSTNGLVERQLDIYNKQINEEISRKRKEFHLDK